MRYWRVAATTAALMLGGAASAHADTRYVSPAGGDTECTHDQPCALSVAPAKVADDDVVLIAPGEYGGADVRFRKRVHLVGASPRPVLNLGSLQLLKPGSSMVDLTVRGNSRTALVAVGSLVERVEATHILGTDTVCELDGADAVMLDSACYANPAVAEGANAIAVNTWTTTTGTDGEVALFNVTAVSPATGIIAQAGDAFVGSSIVVGGEHDVVAYGSAGVYVDSSRVADVAGDVYSGDGVIGAAPETIFPAGGIRPGAGSPTIDAGVDDVLDGETDLDGRPRKLGPHVDMGAFEWQPTAPAVTTGGVAAGQGVATFTGSVDARGDATFVHVEYGPTAAYGSSSPEKPILPATLPKDVELSVTGFSPSTTYHYRIVARNAYGTTAGEDRVFTTPAPFAAPPLITPPPAAAPPKPAVTISLTSNKLCRASRTQTLRVKIASGGTITRVEVYVNKKRKLRVTKAKDLKKSIKLDKLPRGSYTLEVRVRTNDGRTVKSSKRYRTC